MWQALVSVAGTALMIGQEISWRKAFLAEDTSARVLLEGLPPQRVATFPYGHPKGVVIFLCVAIASVLGAAVFWEAFVMHTISTV